MNLEIERKFLVINNEFKKEAYQKKYLVQGYLNTNKKRTVRVRIEDDKAFITIKGESNKSGTTRFEWEKEINLAEAKELLNICEDQKIEKYRYLVKINNHVFEVDEFLGANKGLIIAEVELTDEKEKFNKPSWLGVEVTGLPKYYNSNLSKLAFKNWV